MALNAPAKPPRPLIEAGPTRGVCFTIVDLGTALNEFDGKHKRQVLIGFELPDITEKFNVEGKEVMLTRTIYKFATLSMNEKATLRIMLQSWTGKGMTDEEAKKFDLFTLLGKSALINVVHKTKNGDTKADIGSITAMPKGMAAPVASRASVKFSMADDTCNSLNETIPPWIQAIIVKSDEYKEKNGDIGNADEPDASPF